MEKKFKRTLITTALPYANGPVHIGHLAGVYVPADIYARYLRLKGEEVIMIGGSDEHGVPITIRAKKEGITPQDVVDRYHNIIKKSFEDFGISFDIYSRTTSATHRQMASDFFRTLYDKGEFIEKTSEQYYDEEAKQFLADRYITGTCPHCGNEKAYGDQCEACGTSLSPTDLINPKSAISGSQPVMRETKHWYLPLDKWEPFLRQWILEGHKEWKPNVYGQCKSWLDMGLQPRAVSRDLDWGIPVPLLNDVPFSASGLALGGFMAIGWLVTVFAPQSMMIRLGGGVLRGLKHSRPAGAPSTEVGGAPPAPVAPAPKGGGRGTVLFTIWAIITVALCAMPILGMPINWMPFA